MASFLRQVQDEEELRAVNKWLESYLPESWAMHSLTRCVLSGRWTGFLFHTLGWPAIRGAVCLQRDPDHPSPDFYDNCPTRYVYAHSEEDVHTLLNLPGFVDCSKSFVYRAMPERIGRLMKEMVLSRGKEDKLLYVPIVVFRAKPGDVTLRPVPEGFKVRPVKTDSDIDYCVSTWKYRKPHTDQYFRGLVSNLPSICVADEQDVCMSFELGSEYGSVGFLYTREEARRKGLARVVMSHLADEYRKLNWDVYACIVTDNDLSYSLHEKMGFTPVGNFSYVQYRPEI